MNKLEFGMVVEVDGFTAKVSTFKDFNHSKFFYNGEIIKNVSVNSFIIINQGFTKIVGRIISETITDNSYNGKEYQLDDRFTKNSINRIVSIQAIGYIENQKFISGASYLPMIGNVCRIPTTDEINQIYLNNYISDYREFTITIGYTLQENIKVNLPVNEFFASHLGVFGNTGSGKSNTLHKLYYELFSLKNLPKLKEKSKFLVLDFNGEYAHDYSFGINKGEDKKVYQLTTKGQSNSKFSVTERVFFEEEMLSILFSATEQTQRPFLSRVIKGRNKYGSGTKSLSRWVNWLYKTILTSEVKKDVLNLLNDTLEKYIDGISEYMKVIKKIEVYTGQGKAKYRINSIGLYFNGDLEEKHIQEINLSDIIQHIEDSKIDKIKELELRCHLQMVADLLYGNIIEKHITPLIRRIESRLHSIQKYLTIVEDDLEPPFLQIISLSELNQDAKKILSMLVAKMYYDDQKSRARENKSFHLIIDEAHNVLMSQMTREQDSWSDYRLDLFEEIIKEGRKYNFFLTISSQRPADISPTILSQVHNYFLHKLVNDRDLQIVENTLSTLDRLSKAVLPVLATGVCIISGTALTMPISVKVDFIHNEDIRPQSDTINLIDTWSQ